MKNYRIPRLQEELKKIFNITLSQRLGDPCLAWVNITDVIISKDLRYAKIYFSHYNNPASHQEIREHLIKTSGFFKKQIAGAHIMRTIPELSFFYDDTEDRAAKVEALLAGIKDDYDDEDDYDPDIDIDDYLDDDEYYEYDDDLEEDDYDDFDDDDEDDD
ncbi:MAG: 30S ribosome-binding factor RbfA [Candidatus Cloacimonadales bacterium]|jgi:ribosome-binding factor A|nr:30S ribosome-binding factor RbfA [Candidatus Cloacimonadota bacterium]MDY0381393.1 30S ribosome-binding factor RbfA [Candidatus Cloacimonadaceae bacterium]MCB5255893.1 30S ribosome-binding factor RbfA [Candidatus Cloacimonadota bacterium]MCB5263747.1 30S ribosome-binding factor RbfA [Candidatus Cloacimonadota bacterium]MCB5277076.1 30S ribosome-binding factor RbfA [Candidatus Cloacimonadota bacterium]